MRQQLAVYKRTATRPRLRRNDRLFWVCLARVWAGWRQPLVIVLPTPSCGGSGAASASTGPSSPAGPPGAVRPSTPRSSALVRRMAAVNPLWGAPRIHGELLKLGIEVAERTVSRLMPKRRSPPSQTWRAFLTNHVRDLVSDRFLHRAHRTAARALRPRRARPPPPPRRPLQRHRAPTAAWTAQQIVDAFPDDIRAVLSPPRSRPGLRPCLPATREGHGDRGNADRAHSPWQNPFVERLIGSVRRECLDHVLGLSERHLRRILTRYFAYYHQARTHLALDKDAPDVRPIQRPETGKIVQLPKSVACIIATSAKPRNSASSVFCTAERV